MATATDEPVQRRQPTPGQRARFGDVLRRLRRHAKLTQSDLAKRVGLQGHAFLSQVENGRLPLPAHWLVPLATELQVNAQRLAWIFVALETPDLYEAIGGRKPPDLDPDTLLRMLYHASGRGGDAAGINAGGAPAARSRVTDAVKSAKATAKLAAAADAPVIRD